MDEEDYRRWDAAYQEAAGSLSSDGDMKVNQIADALEKDLELVGITAIEDKLQVASYSEGILCSIILLAPVDHCDPFSGFRMVFQWLLKLSDWVGSKSG